MKICIVSDSHDNRRLLETAVSHARGQGAQAVLHCGDVVAPTTLRVLQKFELPVHVIHGNNTGDLYNMSRLAAESSSVIRYHGQDAAITLADRNLFLVHYPHYARALACTGDYDVVCCGHDHKASVVRVSTVKGGHTWLINPGTVGGVGNPPTYVMANLETMQFDIVAVEAAAASILPPVTPHV